MEAYDANRPATDDSPDKDWLRCQVTGEIFLPDSVKAAHIVPASLGTELATYILGEEKGTRLFSVDNCLIPRSQIEREHLTVGVLSFCQLVRRQLRFGGGRLL
jgi:hypothetical protein